jgi:hypothetical protein
MTANIAKALAAAQMEMGKALKQSQNPAFRSKYADLGNVMDACMGALNKHGIAVIQPMQETEYGRCVVTKFIHESGETLECPVPLIVQKQDMQGLGSAYTYARRYGLMALAGIAPEDDDGNAAAAAAIGKIHCVPKHGQCLFRKLSLCRILNFPRPKFRSWHVILLSQSSSLQLVQPRQTPHPSR